MILEGNQEQTRNPWLGPALLVLGLVIGSLIGYRIHGLARSGSTVEIAVGETTTELSPLLRKGPESCSAPGNHLQTLYLDIAPEQAEAIQRVYNKAKQRNQIVQESDDTVPASLRFEDKSYPVEMRIKGDLTDHIASDKWSFRIIMKSGKLMGMRTFSIQDPLTRGFLWEWVVHQAARYAGILAPRSLFVNVVINNHVAGIYFLAEHFSKELLESQGRREGPIVLFDESSYWLTCLQRRDSMIGHDVGEAPAPVQPAKDVSRAGVRAYDEKHLSSIETLNRALISALQKIRNVQKEIITKKQNSSRLDQLRSLAALKGKTMDRFMDVELWGRAHALSSVFQIWHGMVWFNLRFFFNPVTDRLEPILYDNMAHSPSVRDPVIFIPDPLVLSLAESGQYTLSFHRNLARFCETPFFEELFRKIGPDLIRYQSALDQESKLPVEFRFDTIKQRLRTQQIYLKEMIHPLDAVNFDCAFLLQEGSTSTVSATCEVKAWSTTRMPPLLLGFNFSNGHFISARSCWSGPESMQPVLDGQGVMLPPDGEPLLFRFPADWRLTNLRNLKEFKDAIRQNQPNRGKGASIRISALYRMAAGGEVREEPLVFHACEEAWTLEEGRPCSPSLAEALDRYPCLEYQMDTDELHVRGGTWTLKEDLLVPAGYALHIPEGVTLRFAAEAALVTDSPLFFKGTAERPVVLEPEEGLESWSGILVLNAKERSLWEHAVIRKTNNIMRAGWITTGGITFYHSPVTLIDTSIEATLAEDGLNLFGTDFLMERVVFSGCASDSFDGDFVTGTVRDCLFRDGRADGVDFSGSHVTVENCVFTDLLDKGLSIGENTKCKVIGCSIQRTLIGLASKDSSTVSVQGLSLEGIRNFSIAVYVKKPEYGPSRVEAGGLSFAEGPRAPFLVQTGCELLVDGNLVPTEEVDVERLYEEKLLGN